MKRIAVLAVLAACAATELPAAGLGDKYTSYVSMHRDTDYGSLFLNEGSVRIEESRARKHFAAIKGSGEIILPANRGYCFVFNHYDSPSGNDTKSVKYRAKIEKRFSDGTTTVEPFESSYVPTKKVWSSNLPDLCLRGLRDVTNISIEFSSDDGRAFNWNISFAPK